MASPIDIIIQERQKCFGYKNIAPIKSALENLLDTKIHQQKHPIRIDDTIRIGCQNQLDNNQRDILHKALIAMKPWRKGPFEFFDYFVDTEWQSHIKYNLIKPHLDIQDKCVIDIGCNNGYYLFKMLEEHPKKLIGFDPSALYNLQFQLADAFIQSGITYELLGVEHIEDYVNFKKIKPDVILLLGVLYHRISPIDTLKTIARSMSRGAQLILDCFIIDGDEDIALCPQDTYSKIPNVYFVPTVKTLTNWLMRAKFDDIEVIAVTTTTQDEQRKTDWIDTQSLGDFIDPHTGLTTEGYPPPKRCYIKCKKN